MNEITTKNGIKVKIGVADFDDAMDLKSSILLETRGSDLDLNGLEISAAMNVMDFVKIGMSVAASKEVREALFRCLVRSTYDGQKITKKTFENIEARRDYYEVAIACMKVNVLPFFEGLSSVLSVFWGAPSKTTKSQK
jgi:hypothetical protein